MMTKRFKKYGFLAAAMVIGASAIAGTASAQDMRHGGPVEVRHVEKVVVVQQPVRQPVVVVQQPVRQPVVVTRGGLFDRLDINNNGAVSKWEFTQRYGDSRAAMRAFNRVDSNHSGKLSMQEVAQGRGYLNELRVRG